jgi:hypothetical protein
MGNVTKYSEQLIKRNRDISQAMFEFGQSFTWLGQGEGDIIGEGLTHVSIENYFRSIVHTVYSANLHGPRVESFPCSDEYSLLWHLQLGEAAESLSVITSAHAEEQVIKLLEPFEEYSRMLSSIKVSVHIVHAQN